MNVATTIRNQIVSLDKLAFSAWGAKDMVAMAKDSGLQFRSSGLATWRGIVQIIYDRGADAYTVRFVKYRKGKEFVKAEYDHVYVENLVPVIDEVVQ